MTDARIPWSFHSIASADGTLIGYRQIGAGPGLVILHGTMESSGSHAELAEALSRAFTVYLPDRRGRGMSGPFGEHYCLQKEVEDLSALLAKTRAQRVLGVSVGSIVLLRCMLSHSSIFKAVIFEPPLIIKGSTPVTWIPRYEREITQGKTVAALVTATKGLQFFGNGVPRWLLGLLTKLMMAVEERNATSDGVTMRLLAPTLHYDIQLAMEMGDTFDDFYRIKADVLLLGGSKSPTYMKVGLRALEKVIPRAERVELDRLNHGATGNANRRGDPERVAKTLRAFLRGQQSNEDSARSSEGAPTQLSNGCGA